MEDTGRLVWQVVNNAIKQLNDKGTTGGRAGKRSAWATAMLAKLRRSAGTQPGKDANVWEVTLGRLPDDMSWYERERAEWAIHTALTLYALHQQGKDDCISADGVDFGTAVQLIVDPDKSNEQGVRRRFNAFATAGSLEELSRHARSLVQLMKAKGAKLDYPRFAQDLYWYQAETLRDRTRMKWGRHFYSYCKNNNDNSEEKNTDE